MQGTDVDKLAGCIVARMKEERHAMWIDPETHAAQHEFVMLLMAERDETLRRRKALEDKIAGSLILSLILGLVGLIGSGAMGWLREHLK